MIRQLSYKEYAVFAAAHAIRSGQFLHTEAWETLQVALGRSVERYGMEINGVLVAVAFAIRAHLPGGYSYLYLPRGPLVNDVAHLNSFMDALGAETGVIFIRTEPQMKPVGGRWEKTIDGNPACTQLTHLQLTNCPFIEEIHPKCRYNIRLAERHGVQIAFDQPFTDEIWALFETTTTRSQIRPHPRSYYEQQLALLQTDEVKAMLAVAYVEEKAIAAAIVFDAHDVRTYVHGASGSTHRNIMGPHLLHIKLMMEACERGISVYDWWGIAPPEAGSEHPLAGVTKFKRQFGGEVLQLPGTYDWIVRPWHYRAYKFARKVWR